MMKAQDQNQQAGFRQQGFSLLELAIVMLVLGILMSGILVSIGSTLENSRRNETRTRLNEITEALYGFAQVHGRLPCPSTAANAGFETPLSGGVCLSYHGFVPAATLGLSGPVNQDGLLLDAWQNPLRYSVAATSEPGGGFTSTADMKTLFNNPPLSASPPLLRVCNTADCSDIINTDTAPAVVISMGSNWRTISAAQAAEQSNGSGSTDGVYPLTNTNDFVSADYSEDAFDDLLVWLSPQILFSRQIAAGRLP